MATAKSFFLISGFLAVGCMSAWGQARGGAAPQAPAAAEPRPNSAGGDQPAGVDPKTFVIGPGDVIRVDVWKESDYSRTVTVRPDGKITLPTLNDVQAEGRTPEQLTQDLKKKLSETLIRPEVIVDVMGVNSKWFTVTGKVGRPGKITFTTTPTIFDALNQVGFQDWANQKDILVIRGDQRMHFNYKDYLKGNKGPNTTNFEIKHGDTIYVK